MPSLSEWAAKQAAANSRPAPEAKTVQPAPAPVAEPPGEAKYQASIDFLHLFRPGGPWVLTAIHPDKKDGDKDKIRTATFRSDADVLRWLERYGDFCNLYYMANPARRDLSSKATKADVEEAAWLWTDVDDPEARPRIDAFPLKPTVIVFSGGGWQPLWKLDPPIPIEGEEAKWEDPELRNKRLIEVLGGDKSCFNIDRVLRLPGTINRPDARKRKRGRAEALATFEWFGGVYSPSQFEKAVAARKAVVVAAPTIRRLEDVQELGPNVSDNAKVLIVQGEDPNGKKYGDGSRSDALFYAVCEMVRGGVADEIIYSVITDPDFGISASVLDKGSSMERYALRQIERAKDKTTAPELLEMNDRFFVIGNFGGKCRVVEDREDPALRRKILYKQSWDDFKNRFSNRKVEIGKDANGNAVYSPLGKWWQTHPRRRQYDRLVFVPGQETPGDYNLWQGFAVEPKKGDVRIFLWLVREVICAGNEEHFRYVIRWMARAVQRPAEPGYTVIFLRGAEGTFKSYFAKLFGGLFGRHFLHVTDPRHVMGNFNAHLRDCVILFGDEISLGNRDEYLAKLKGIATEETIVIEPKGVDAEACPNFVHLLVASNDPNITTAGVTDRRQVILDVADRWKKSPIVYRRLEAWREAGGPAALLHYLKDVDLSDFNVELDRPVTAALREIQETSLSADVQWWRGQLDDESLWDGKAYVEDVLYDFAVYIEATGGNKKSLETRLGMLIKKMTRGRTVKKREGSGARDVRRLNGTLRVAKRPMYYVFPPLAECREIFAELYPALVRPEEAVVTPTSDLPEVL